MDIYTRPGICEEYGHSTDFAHIYKIFSAHRADLKTAFKSCRTHVFIELWSFLFFCSMCINIQIRKFVFFISRHIIIEIRPHFIFGGPL